MEVDNILKIKEYKEDNNHIWELDNELYDKKYEEYKKQIDNEDYKFNDTILNMSLIFRRMKDDKDEKYRLAGNILYNMLYKNIEEDK